jgi:hypothetical protein
MLDVSALYVFLLDDIVFMVVASFKHVVILCVLSSYLYVWTCYVLLTILMFYLDAGLLARSQYPEGPSTGHLGTGFFLGFPLSNSKFWDGSQN